MMRDLGVGSRHSAPHRPVIELAARLVCALQRERDLLELSDEADRLLEGLGLELGRMGVFASLGLLDEVDLPEVPL